MAYISDAGTSGSAMSRANLGKCLGIYYQNFRGLRTKQLEIYDNVCATDFDIICLRHGSTTRATITIYFLIVTPCTGLTGHILTRLVGVVF
jgi:hypothetical protein